MPGSVDVRGAIVSLRGISSMAMRGVLGELADAFEQRSRQSVDVVAVGGVDAARRIREGEPFDFVVLASEAIDKLAVEGHIDPATRTDLARSDIAIAVAADAMRPDLSTESAVRAAVLRARTIGYSTGPSGAHVARLFERWGVGNATTPRLVQAPPGIAVGTLIARGEVELGFQQLSELMNVPGIDIIGPLPPSLQRTTIFTAAVCITSKHKTSANEFITFLASPQAEAAKHRHGMFFRGLP
ncbi:MAG TPA: substrate-binding domain-containing protein [Casimicrobiaceae bacterium]|nr:substrate-binding domain-containing protein [Casimicrobiaceae bacterium]